MILDEQKNNKKPISCPMSVYVRVCVCACVRVCVCVLVVAVAIFVFRGGGTHFFFLLRPQTVFA